MPKTERRVDSRDLLVIERQEPKVGEKWDKEGWVIRVIQWLYENNKGGIGSTVCLEKRVLYIEDGEVRNGKAKGFTLADLGTIQKRWREIVECVKNPPEPEWPTGGANAKPAREEATENLDDVPF